METKFFELANGNVLGVKVFEVMSFPSIDTFSQNQNESCMKIYKSFLNLASELYKLSGTGNCIELLWIADRVENQTFLSEIHIFSVIRKMGTDKNVTANELDGIEKNILSTLSSLQFQVDLSESVYEILMNYLNHIDKNCTFGIVKNEQCVANSYSLSYYYYSEIVPQDNIYNFNSLLAALSQCEKSCISFQIFPTALDNQEMFVMNELSAEWSKIADGVAMDRQIYKDPLAKEPAKVLSYYNDRRNSAVFMYNILVFGNRVNCANLATKVISLLQSGEQKISNANFMCLDLSGEKIDLGRDFLVYTWNVNNRLVYYYRNKQLQSEIPMAGLLFRLPYIMSAEEVAAFYRLPLYEKSMSYIKSNQKGITHEQFLDSVVNKNNIRIGTLISNGENDIVIGCPERDFTKHGLIVGTPGSGKTTFSIHLLLQFAKRGIPFLAIEPTKSEYRALIDAIPDLQIFTPGNNAVSPYIVNPFIPPKGIKIEKYIPSLASAFKAAFSMPSPLDSFFMKAIRVCYTQYGWKDYSMIGDADVTEFGLHEFVIVFKKLVKSTNYSKEVKGNMESAGLLRLTNLIEQNSNIYDTINTVSIEDILTKPTVLELNAIDNAEQKSLIMALLLINICVYTKHNVIGDGTLKNIILIDEAHVLLGGKSQSSSEGSAETQSTTVKALQDMIAEIRSFGTGILIADQSPTKVGKEVIANTDIKIAFRLVQASEKELIADSTNMEENESRNLSKLRPGEAYVYYGKLDTPQMVMTEDIREKEGIRLSVSDNEIADRSRYWSSHQELLKPYTECRLCQYCTKTCDFVVRSDADYIAGKAFSKFSNFINSQKNLHKVVYNLQSLMADEYQNYDAKTRERLIICSKIKLLRKAELELSFDIPSEKKEKIMSALLGNNDI